MLDWWVWIVKALNSAARRWKNGYFKKQLENMEIFLSSWDSLSKAMKKLPRIFSKFEYSLVEAWEASWNVTDALENLSYIFQKKYLLKKKLIWALTYPFIIFIVLILAIMVVMLMVIPQIRWLFDEAWIELPASTKALIASSDFFSNNFFLIIFWFLVIWFLIYLYRSTTRWKYDFEMLIFSTPLVWEVYKNYILSGIAANLWNLLAWWVPIIQALDLTWKATNSKVYEDLFQDIKKKVSLWEKIVDSMREADEEEKFFPADFLQMLEVWEKTASIWKVAKKMVNQYEREVDFSLANLTRWIEPSMIAFAWIFVLWFAFSIFWAILKITEAV
jgi:type II secretory pathway component PulF